MRALASARQVFSSGLDAEAACGMGYMGSVDEEEFQHCERDVMAHEPHGRSRASSITAAAKMMLRLRDTAPARCRTLLTQQAALPKMPLLAQHFISRKFSFSAIYGAPRHVICATPG